MEDSFMEMYRNMKVGDLLGAKVSFLNSYTMRRNKGVVKVIDEDSVGVIGRENTLYWCKWEDIRLTGQM